MIPDWHRRDSKLIDDIEEDFALFGIGMIIGALIVLSALIQLLLAVWRMLEGVCDG